MPGWELAREGELQIVEEDESWSDAAAILYHFFFQWIVYSPKDNAVGTKTIHNIWAEFDPYLHLKRNHLNVQKLKYFGPDSIPTIRLLHGLKHLREISFHSVHIPEKHLMQKWHVGPPPPHWSFWLSLKGQMKECYKGRHSNRFSGIWTAWSRNRA